MSIFTHFNKLNTINYLFISMLQKIQQRLNDIVSNDELDNFEIIQLIEQLGGYLNIQTIPQKAKSLGVDYNCVKMSNIEKVELFGVKFVIDND